MKGMRRQNGYALVWAVVGLLIVAIIVVAAVGLGRAYGMRNVKAAYAEQAYLSARSAVDALTKVALEYGNQTLAGDTPLTLYPADPQTVLPAAATPLTISTIRFRDNDETMGEARGRIEWVEYSAETGGVLRVTVESAYRGQTAVVSRDIAYEVTRVTSGGGYTDFAGGLAGVVCNSATWDSRSDIEIDAETETPAIFAVNENGNNALKELDVEGDVYKGGGNLNKNKVKCNNFHEGQYIPKPTPDASGIYNDATARALPSQPDPYIFPDGAGGNVYKIEDNNYPELRFTDSGDYYFIIAENITFSTSVIRCDPGAEPQVFFLLGSGSGIYISKDNWSGDDDYLEDIRLYITSATGENGALAEGAYAKFEDGAEMTGAVHCTNVDFTGDADIDFVPPGSGGTGGGTGGTGGGGSGGGAVSETIHTFTPGAYSVE